MLISNRMLWIILILTEPIWADPRGIVVAATGRLTFLLLLCALHLIVLILVLVNNIKFANNIIIVILMRFARATAKF